MPRPVRPPSTARSLVGVSGRTRNMERRYPPPALPRWTEVDPSTILINDGLIDPSLSYLKTMVQGTTPLSSVFVVMRLVSLGSLATQVISLPGLADYYTESGRYATSVLFAGCGFSSTGSTWDTPHPAYMLADGNVIYTDDFSATVGGGDIFFAGGGVYPYGAAWPTT